MLVSSYYFYMCWIPQFILLIMFSTTVDYIAGIMMGRTQEQKKRKKFLLASIFINLGILFTFKYFNFFMGSVESVMQLLHIPYNLTYSNLLLPVGISFYTFQAMSYTIDVYWNRIKPEKHLGIFALYVTFFPQLVAGPIERSENLLPQFYKKYDFDAERIADGMRLMLWGFFKKIVIADRLGVFVDFVYNYPSYYTGIFYIIATIFFAFQIFCDFSGYSDIALGSAKIMGFNLMKNFDKPYHSRSIHEFWKRWHISLSTWFKDYLYIPLGGNRVGKNRHYLNLFLTFLISGLWHGASWTFVAWGALHGFYLVFGLYTKRIRTLIAEKTGLTKLPKFHALLQTATTFVLVCFAWIFFRSNNIKDAFHIIGGLFNDFGIIFNPHLIWKTFGNIFFQQELIFGLIAVFILETVHFTEHFPKIRELFLTRFTILRWSFYSVLVCLILYSITFTINARFIYFQF